MWQKLRDFLVFFISIIQPIWAPDKQVKRVSLKICFRRDIQIFSSKNSTLRNFLTTQPLKKIILMYLNFFFFSIKARRGLQSKKLVPAKLRAGLACAESDSAQCQPAQSQLHAVSQPCISANFSKKQHASYTVFSFFKSLPPRSVSLHGVTYCKRRQLDWLQLIIIDYALIKSLIIL